MADDGSFSRSSTICFFLILMLSEVIGIRTGDHVFTRRNLLQLLNDQGLTKFLDLITKAEIQGTFTSTEEMTVFAFNNTAFDILPSERKTAIRKKNREETENFVKFHTVYKERILTENMLDNSRLKSNGLNQNILFVNKKRLQIGVDYDKTEQIFINGARIVKRDIYATNGILQIIDRVLEITSNKMAVPYLDHPDDPRVKGKQFYDLVRHSEARDELKNEAQLTLFVPTDKAMERINKEKLDQQRQNPQALKEIILKHRISNQVIFTSTVEFGTQWTPNSNIPILNKNTYEQVFVTSGDTTAQIVLGNVTVGNGVIHMIDNLLGFTYNNVMEQIIGDPQLS
ncbi:unnamed protein product [Acanthosepion pharaonis]|uniref:FAS1 domain-containing protein n=1 Tax=Acanthosepion pharaonis TaxID=158019 RepID=A0A812DD89_ACAPH|nr:unnamed protein product [Sepia pharaonis]